MAVRLARWYEAELHVAHLGSRVRSQNKSVTARAVDRELSARLDNFVAAVKAEGLKVETVILQGDAVSALVDYTRSVSGDLIIVSPSPPVRRRARAALPTARRRTLALPRLSRTSSAGSTFQSLLRSR